jgi:DNA polymerase-3 subunit gamma/tau|uniref:AAA+ ATPase domain-containing protein n=1 Tax=viral metagenome TaxID=1070528 RepID=A0A6C0LU33_9ZZZZ
MTNITFINKYKPYYINDFCLDDKLLYTLKILLEIDNLNILFVGNSNSGKTTLLYALIREYYGLKKDASLPENNILFINNLKEQGIQYFRNEMKTFCQSHSSIYGKKKLVIIDDIDNINEQSQQVFRNYIDKYRNNIHFISVCSNIQKVIESIQSRLQLIKLNPPNDSQIENIMNTIIKNENIEIDKESKQYLLLITNGSIRNLINYLEKMYILGEPITIELCKNICSNISFHEFEKYVDHLKQNELTDAIQLLYNIHDYGYSVIDILDYFFSFTKLTNVIDEETKYRIIPFLCKYITIFHNVHEDCIELALFTNNLARIIHQ